MPHAPPCLSKGVGRPLDGLCGYAYGYRYADISTGIIYENRGSQTFADWRAT